MRDLETMQTVLSAAETGHLVFSSLHTTGAANTINRIIDVFPAEKQQQIRVQLSMVLQAIVSQQLIPAVGGGLIPAFEIMKVNNAVQTQIRENKIHQIDNTIQANAREGMITMDASLSVSYTHLDVYKRQAGKPLLPIVNYYSEWQKSGAEFHRPPGSRTDN